MQPSYFTNCIIEGAGGRYPQGGDLFAPVIIKAEDVGAEVVVCALDNYAIVEKDTYLALHKANQILKERVENFRAVLGQEPEEYSASLRSVGITDAECVRRMGQGRQQDWDRWAQGAEPGAVMRALDPWQEPVVKKCPQTIKEWLRQLVPRLETKAVVKREPE